MLRTRMVIDQNKAKEIYQYFSKALFEKRIFKNNPKELEKAQQAFLKIPSLDDEHTNAATFKRFLQEWVSMYVPQHTWQRCLATLRQIRSNQKHEVKSIKINKETYILLKSYADRMHLNVQQAIHSAIEPLLKQTIRKDDPTSIILESTIPHKYKKEINVKIWLCVENNNKFVRGKGKVQKDIEDFLEEYNVKKDADSDGLYILTIGYNNQKDLDETIDEIHHEMASIADLLNCFIEADIYTLDGKKRW